jgi:hypothetical protein
MTTTKSSTKLRIIRWRSIFYWAASNNVTISRADYPIIESLLVTAGAKLEHVHGGLARGKVGLELGDVVIIDQVLVLGSRGVELHVTKPVQSVRGVVDVSTDAHEEDGTISSVYSEPAVVKLQYITGLAYSHDARRKGGVDSSPLTLSVKLAAAGYVSHSVPSCRTSPLMAPVSLPLC